MSSKINWLVANTYPGSLVLQPWLTEHGIRYSLAQKYTHSGWLHKLSSGVYCRPGKDASLQPGWVDAMHALDAQLHLPVHLAGLSSLIHQGLGHYLPLGQEHVWVGIANKQSLPKWFRNFPNHEWLYCGNHKLVLQPEQDLKTLPIKGVELKVSSPELAAYEVVDAIGKLISFESAAELFQGLVNLSPRKVQSILERSSAVKTNRVFLFLAHHHDHPWLKRLDESTIELGAGKRQVVANGRYDDRYLITVPASLSSKGEEERNG